MSALSEFHFLRPEWLLALPALLALLWWMAGKRHGSSSWELVCDATLIPYILTGSPARQRRLSLVLTAVGGLLAILALAGPAWEKLPQPVFTHTRTLVIALDLTRSMDATDISPSRLARARFKIADMLKRRTEGQTALLVYAGDSFTVTPLTDDTETINAQLNALSAEIMPAPGNNTVAALRLAQQLLKQAGVADGDILLITDEIEFDAAREYAVELQEQGYRVSVLGVGTEQGVPIPMADGSFLKDSDGRIVIPALVEEPLRRLAAAGGGLYQRIAPGDEDTDRLLKFFAGRGGEGEIAATELKTDAWREQGPWLVLGLLPLLAILFRRGYLAALLICLLPAPQSPRAMDWSDLWYRPDQQARRAFDAGDAQTAAKLFRDPAWKGSAQYKSGDYEGAARSLEPLDDMESRYNLGNALARLGRYEEAIAAYDQVLQQDPRHADARHNKELLEKELQQQQSPQQQSGQNQDQQQGQSRQDQSPAGAPEQQGQRQNPGENEQSSAGEERAQTPQQDEQRPDLQQAQPEPDQEQEEANGAEQRELAQSDEQPLNEDQQATEQWLRRIPDDPGGLLRRKFLYQYQQRGGDGAAGDKTW
jgi:Ca-activated chloride channel family protein